MLVTVTGGAGSGKSEFAEQLIVDSGISERCYIATMQVWDDECRKRVDRHRQMRQGKGFQTVECPFNLFSAVSLIPEGSAVLLEDLTNLASNEWFCEKDPNGMERRVVEGVRAICERAELVVVVTNELFSDGINYNNEINDFLKALGLLNKNICAHADLVYEVVCGIPVCWKGRKK